MRRELNLTQSNLLPNDNVITNGQAQFNGVGQVSVESKTAESLGIQIGDKLTFSLPEGNLQAKVVNFRSVEWESFSLTFSLFFT